MNPAAQVKSTGPKNPISSYKYSAASLRLAREADFAMIAKYMHDGDARMVELTCSFLRSDLSRTTRGAAESNDPLPKAEITESIRVGLRHFRKGNMQEALRVIEQARTIWVEYKSKGE